MNTPSIARQPVRQPALPWMLLLSVAAHVTLALGLGLNPFFKPRRIYHAPTYMVSLVDAADLDGPEASPVRELAPSPVKAVQPPPKAEPKVEVKKTPPPEPEPKVEVKKTPPPEPEPKVEKPKETPQPKPVEKPAVKPKLPPAKEPAPEKKPVMAIQEETKNGSEVEKKTAAKPAPAPKPAEPAKPAPEPVSPYQAALNRIEKRVAEETKQGGGGGGGRRGRIQAGGPGFDLTPYDAVLAEVIRSSWIKPQALADLLDDLVTVVVIRVHRSGRIAYSEIEESSGNEHFDESIRRVLNKVVFPPLPAAYPKEFHERHFRFHSAYISGEEAIGVVAEE